MIEYNELYLDLRNVHPCDEKIIEDEVKDFLKNKFGITVYQVSYMPSNEYIEKYFDLEYQNKILYDQIDELQERNSKLYIQNEVIKTKIKDIIKEL